MRQELVEIYSDATNNAIMRHPARRFPGLLIQGDTLYSICRSLDEVCNRAGGKLDDDAFSDLNHLRSDCWERLEYYTAILEQHGIKRPF